jgi:quinohemoprotein ethanol dehydrogenase
MSAISFRSLPLFTALAAGVLALSGCTKGGVEGGDNEDAKSLARLVDTNDGADWAGYGRTFGQQHYSPLDQIGTANAGQLGLAWSLDLPLGNSNTQPIEVGGVLYMATGLSIVRAVDAVTGKELWSYDPEVGAAVAKSGSLNMRVGWGVRGVAWWDGKIFTGTQDGRLIAVDAKTGKLVWSTATYGPNDPAYITGAPRVYGGKVLIGNAQAIGKMRGFIAAYDAQTGRRDWIFYTVPGNPADGFENKAMEMAAKTWSGEWWKFGGGSAVWHSIAYDPESGLVYFGTGSPYPWNHRIRSQGKGDNLFADSIVAVDLKTGEYRWHYQVVPADTWDFDATMDIELADLTIDGKPRKVLMQAPKDGFFYVIDRITGKLISAEPFVKVNWASKVDLATGRPVENPQARFTPQRAATGIAPTPLAAHNWMPMSFSPKTGLMYIPAVDWEVDFADVTRPWEPSKLRGTDNAVDMKGGAVFGMKPPVGFLLAWDPVKQKEVWRVRYPTYYNGGTAVTAGGLVFQGSIDGKFRAYDAVTGKLAWEYDVKAPVLAPPITYSVKGKQYVTVLTGLGMGYVMNSTALAGPQIEQYGIDPRTQARRVLTFAIGGKGVLPERAKPAPAFEDPGFVADPARVMAGMMAYSGNCLACHGALAVGIGHAPDLRRSPVVPDKDTFGRILHEGLLQQQGMPKFAELTPAQIEDIRHYLRARAADLRKGSGGAQPAKLDIK